MDKEIIKRKISKDKNYINNLINENDSDILNNISQNDQLLNKIQEFDNNLIQIGDDFIKKGGWSKKEDEILKNWVKEYGPNLFTECSKFIPGRNGKQCRERWVNILDPKIKKGNWKLEDQEQIFELLKEHYTSWSSISKNITGRTENSVKNFFYSTIRRLKSNSIINYWEYVQNNSINENKADMLIEEFKIKSINYLGFLIIEFLLKNNNICQKLSKLKEYLFKIILEDLKKNKFQMKTIVEGINNVIDNKNNMDTNFLLFVNKSDNSDVTVNKITNTKNNLNSHNNLNIFFNLINNLKYNNCSQKMKFSIDKCYNCQKKPNSYHINKINKLFYNSLNNNIDRFPEE